METLPHQLPITFTVYFEGTANDLKSFTTQIGLFYELTDAIDLSGGVVGEVSYDPGCQYKIAFDGCGVTNGMMGTIFATGLQAQCKEVESHIKKMLSINSSSSSSSSLSSLFSSSKLPTKPETKCHDEIVVNLNVVGLSRGGIAAIQLAQTLHYMSPKQLYVNLLLFDPVPGNLIGSSRYFDIFGMNTANSSLDLTYCNLSHVLAIYPYQPLPDLAFHAPVLPKYPDRCIVDEDVTLGCHQGALFCSSRSIESRLSYFRLHEWLEEHGTKLFKHDEGEESIFNCTSPDTTTSTGDTSATTANASVTRAAAIVQANKLSMTPQQCKDLMDEVMNPPDREIESIVRYTHSCPPGAVIVLHALSPSDFVQVQIKNNMTPSSWFLNKHHQELTERLLITLTTSTNSQHTKKNDNNSDSVVTVEKKQEEQGQDQETIKEVVNKEYKLFLEICRPAAATGTGTETMLSSSSLLRSCSK